MYCLGKHKRIPNIQQDTPPRTNRFVVEYVHSNQGQEKGGKGENRKSLRREQSSVLSRFIIKLRRETRTCKLLIKNVSFLK